MKCIVIIFFLFLTCHSADMKGSLEFISRSNCENRKIFENKATVEFSQFSSRGYQEFTLRAERTLDDTNVEIFRAFAEHYRGKYTFSAGRQKISWGNSYFFNHTSIFNTPDPDDPRREKPGTNAFKIRFNPDYTSRFEALAAFEDNKRTLAFRHTFVNRLTEYMFNILYYKRPVFIQTQKYETVHTDYVFEVKGEKTVGYWIQVAFKKTEDDFPVASQIPRWQRFLVSGIDYTFLVHDKTLYTLTELNINQTLQNRQLYCTARYTSTESLSYALHWLKDLEDSAQYLNCSIQYIIDDSYTAQFEYTRYFHYGLTGGSDYGEPAVRITRYF